MATKTKKTAAPKKSAAKKPARKPSARKLKKLSQTDKLIRMLRRGGGVLMDDLVADLKVLRPTARAMISTLRTKRGFTIACKDSRYSITD